MQLELNCSVYPTEDRNRINKAISNLFPNSLVANNDNFLSLTINNLNGLNWLRTRIFEQRIIDAVRSRLLANYSNYTTFLMLDKQFAFVGRVRIIDNTEEEPPLGSIELHFSFLGDFEFNQFLSWFTPPTENGHAVLQ